MKLSDDSNEIQGQEIDSYEMKQLMKDNIDSNDQPLQAYSTEKWRAKLYRLNADGGWDDLGTGNSQIVALHDDEPHLIVLSENEENELYN